MSVRVLLLASVSAALVAESGMAYAQDENKSEQSKDKGSYTTELPPVEVSPPKTESRPGRPRTAARVVRPVTRVRVYPTSPIATPGTALSVDKVPSSINFVDSGQIARTGSLHI